MKNLIKKYTILLGLFLFATIPLFASNSYEVAHEETVIIKVYNEPVGIHSKLLFKDTTCRISCTISPSMRSSDIKIGETFRIQVIDGKDIIVLCNGKKGITISRD